MRLRELERGVERLGSVGGFMNGLEGGSFLDDTRYAPLFEAAEALDVPLYLHPTPPPLAVRDADRSGLPQPSAYFLSTAAWVGMWNWACTLCVGSLLVSSIDFLDSKSSSVTWAKAFHSQCNARRMVFLNL